MSGPIVIVPDVHRDERGFFVETFRAERMRALGIADAWVQDNHSRSHRGTLRGMHFAAGQAKLVRCARGAIWDVVVDIRPASPTFGRYEHRILDDEQHHVLYIPGGFAHGFAVISDVADVTYRISTPYDPTLEGGFHHASRDLPGGAIPWPVEDPIVSPRDRALPPFAEVFPR